MLSTAGLIGGLGLTHGLPRGISELMKETWVSVKLCIRKFFFFFLVQREVGIGIGIVKGASDQIMFTSHWSGLWWFVHSAARANPL